MKKMILFFVLCVSVGTIFAQKSLEFKNAGNEALKGKDYAKALENYEKAIAEWGTAAPDFSMIYNTAVSAFQTKAFDKAVKYFDQVIAGNYNPEDALFNKSLVYKVQKKNEEYLKVINEGIAKYPQNTRFKDGLAKYYLIEGNMRYVNGANLLKSAVDKITSKKYKDTEDPGYKAEIEKAKKEFAAAIPSLVKALELNPADEKAKAIKVSCEKQVKTL